MIVIINLNPVESAQFFADKLCQMGIEAVASSPDKPLKQLRCATGIILTGSPLRIAPDTLGVDKGIYDLGVPILGICYGHQVIARDLGGDYGESKTKTIGTAELGVLDTGGLLNGLSKTETVYFNHNDEVKRVPCGFVVTARTKRCQVSVMENWSRKIYGVQFHPENELTINGDVVLRNFALLGNEDLEELIKKVLERPRIKSALTNKEIEKIIYVKGKVLNIITKRK